MDGSFIQSALITVGSVVGGLLLFIACLGIFGIYGTMRMRLDGSLRPVNPNDPAIPDEARAFFKDVWLQLEPLGFKTSVYLLQQGMISNTRGFLAIYDHAANRDSAAAMVIEVKTGDVAKCSSFVTEFCTDTTDDKEIGTNNNVDPSTFFSLDWKRGLKIPNMRDLAQLYEIHRAHLREAGAHSKAPLPRPDEHAPKMIKSFEREFESLVKVGCLRQTARNEYGLGLWASFIAFFKLAPGFMSISKALVLRRGRRWLAKHEFDPKYEAIQYEPIRFGMTRGDFAGLPLPDWYEANQSDDGILTFNCSKCRGRISSDELSGTLVICPLCTQHIRVPVRNGDGFATATN